MQRQIAQAEPVFGWYEVPLGWGGGGVLIEGEGGGGIRGWVGTPSTTPCYHLVPSLS